jgi:outer membrane protein assembly factor BamB
LTAFDAGRYGLAMFCRRFAFALAFVLLMTTLARAEDWPHWRGPRGDGSSNERDIPTKWSDTENVHWKVAVPGGGHSSPIVVGDKVFLTTALEKEQKRLLICFDRRDGKQIWDTVVLSAPLEGKHQLNSYASATPASDGERVFVSFLEKPKIELVCYDLAGKELWRKSPGEFRSVHGFCSSPVIYKDLVILNCDQDADAWIVAYDRKTGEERWRTDRPNKTRSYCTPLIAELAGKTQMVLSGSKSVASYDPDTGKQIWVMDGPTEQFVASIVHTQGLLFVTGGFPQLHVLGVDPSGSGNVTKTHIHWRDHRGVSYVPSPIAHDQWFFIVSDGGVGSCYEAKTGKILWKERLGRHHSASAVCAGGNVYFVDEDGTTHVLKAGATYEVISENPLGENAYASPAISRGQIFIRTSQHLWCIGKPGTETAGR